MYYMQDTVKHFCHYAHSFVTYVAMPSVFFFFVTSSYILFSTFLLFCHFTCFHTRPSVSRVVTKVFYTAAVFTSSLWSAFLYFLVTLRISVVISHIKLYIHVDCVIHCKGYFSYVFIVGYVLIFLHFFNIFRLVLEMILKCATKQMVSELADQF